MMAHQEALLGERIASTERGIARAEQAMASAAAELTRLRGAAASHRREASAAAGGPRVTRLDGVSASAVEVIAALHRDGTVCIEQLVTVEQMDRLQEELATIDAYGDRAEPGSFFGVNSVTNAAYLVAACPTSQELAMHSLLLEVVQGAGGLFTPYAKRAVLAVATEIKLQGEGPAQALHRDDEEWPLELLAFRKPGVELELQCMWAVSDFAAAGGATCQVPGSHRWPVDREPTPDEIAVVPMPRGSVLLWLGSALHGAGASAAGVAARHGLLLGYCLSWLRPEFNMHFSCPPKVAARMDPRMSTLLGFAGPPNRYGSHPYLTGPAFATEYTGYPGDASDYSNGKEDEKYDRGFQVSTQSKL